MGKRFTVAVFFCFALTAKVDAKIYDLNPSSSNGFSGSSDVEFSGKLAGNDYYNFSLVGSFNYDVGLVGLKTSNLGLTLYSGSYTTGASLGSFTTIPTTYSSSQGSVKVLLEQQASLTSGSYFFAVSGISGSTYGGTFTVSAVPLPPAFPMFASGLVALVLFGLYTKRNGEKTLVRTAAF